MIIVRAHKLVHHNHFIFFAKFLPFLGHDDETEGVLELERLLVFISYVKGKVLGLGLGFGLGVGLGQSLGLDDGVGFGLKRKNKHHQKMKCK